MKTMLIVIAMSIATIAFGKDEQYLTYDDFVRQAESGSIQSVTLDKFSSIDGVMTDGEATNTFRSYAATGSANDPLLTQFLKTHNIGVTMRDVSEPSHAMPMITGFMFLLAPIVFFILMIVIIMKLNRVLANQKDNQQMHAKVHSEGAPSDSL
jgi:ATP-dependent Zn protease